MNLFTNQRIIIITVFAAYTISSWYTVLLPEKQWQMEKVIT